MKLHFLTNDNLLLENKMRYFADYFIYANEYLGKLPHLPFDNPISLFDKIQFQLENNIERCPKSIDMYISQLGYYPLKLTTQVSKSYKPFISEFKQKWNLLKNDTEKKKWLKNEPGILENVIKIKAELNENLFPFAHKALFTFLVCSHPLAKHKKDIQLLTQLIITIFRFKEITKKQVSKYIERLLTRDKYEFPLPLNILKEVQSESFIELRDNFLENRDFKNQFEGLKNILEAYSTRKGYFIYPIAGIHLNDKQQKMFSVKFDKVTFISSKHQLLKKLRISVHQNDKSEKIIAKLYPTFFKKGSVLSIIEMNYEKKKDTAIIAKEIVEKELSFLSTYFNTTKLRVVRDDFLWASNFEDNLWWGNVEILGKRANLCFPNEYQINDVLDNPFSRLRKEEIKSSKAILFNEWVFLKAFNQNDLSAYWLYIENLFWRKNLEKRVIKESFVNLSQSIIPDLLNEYNSSIAFLAYSFHVPEPEEMIGLTDNEAKEIFNSTKCEKKDFNWKHYLPKLKHDFFKDVVVNYLKLSSKKESLSWRNYFSNIAQELSDYRNSELHSGLINEFSRVKLNFILPDIMNLIRWEIIHSAEQNPTLEYTQLIDQLCKNTRG